ncbi:MAG: ABC transporter permease [Trueperaceae bacterium]|nr:ABC transporter permease [Trueperaceae bacterium]
MTDAGLATDLQARAEEGGRSPQRRALRSLLRNPLALIGAGIVVVVILVALLAGVIAPHDPEEMFVIDRLSPPGSQYLFGTDNFGRDLVSRVVYGARTSLRVAALVAGAATLFGVLVGALAGYYRRVDGPLMRVMDAMMAFPSILLALAIMAILGRSVMNVAVALTIVYTPAMARLVRSAVLAAKEHEYVEAMRALGGRDWRLLFAHVLPNAVSVIVVQATFISVYAILSEAGLSFLGAGAPPSIPSWGNILAEGREYMIDAPWIMIFPGLAITFTVLGLNLLGDGLRDALDPRSD